jgi:hypothetical protein
MAQADDLDGRACNRPDVTLTPELEAVVESCIAAGHYGMSAR